MKKFFVILVAVIGFGISVNAQNKIGNSFNTQNKLGANTEVRLKNGSLIYIEEKDNGIGPGTGWIRYLLNKVNWPSGFASCATQHDIDYGTIGVSKYDADMKLKRCAESVYPGTIGDLIKQQRWSLREFSSAIGFFDISEDMKFADAVYALMCNSAGDESYRIGQSMAQTTERYKRDVEEALGMSIDTRRYYFRLMGNTGKNQQTNQTTIVNDDMSQIMNGTWSGIINQPGYGNWRMTINCDWRNKRFTVEYPSLSCGGNLVLINSDERTATFREQISYGLDACINGLGIVFEKRNNTILKVTVTEFNSLTVIASGEISKQN
jgi:hypothetical protein